MESFLESVHNCGDLRYLGRLNVVEAFQRHCIQKYGNFDGIDDVNGVAEGVVRHQPSCEHPISLHKNLGSLHALMLLLRGAASEPCNATRYTTLVNDVKREVIGLSDLKAQMLIMNCASLSLFLPVEFMRHFNTGSTQQLKNLKMPPFLFERAEQVVHLRKFLMTKRPDLLPMQVDGMIFSLSTEKGSSRTDLSYRNHSPYVAMRNENNIVIKRFCCKKKILEAAPHIFFNYSKDKNHYIPTWTRSRSGNPYVVLSSATNYKNKNRNCCRAGKNMAIQLSHMIMHGGLGSHDFCPHLQSLLIAGNYIVMEDLEHEACKHLGCTKAALATVCIVVQTSRGSDGFLIKGDISALATKYKFVGGQRGKLFDLPQMRIPPIGRKCGKDGCYWTREWAERAIMIHLLLNIVPVGRKQWFMEHLTPKRCGFLLLIPTGDSFCVALAYIFLDVRGNEKCDGIPVMCVLLDGVGKHGLPFKIGSYGKDK